MNYQNEIDANYYLARFNEILYNMQREMLITNTTENITIDFIRCMIPHHMAAIYMCQNLLRYSNYTPLVNMANNIIKVQENEVNQMKEIAKTTIYYINNKRDVDNYFKRYFKITQNMINEMRNSIKTTDINLDFTYEMIPHHEGAIKMCQNVLRYQIDPRLRMLANIIIKEQSEGVRMLKEIQYNITKKYPY
ncbi:MAG: DUF305 domain-containing protein [Bacilli bacterium]|nr:DUF305 domain-containing protein [Bacilli bacterium]